MGKFSGMLFTSDFDHTITDHEGNVPESAQSENYRKARRAFLVGYDRAVPKVRQADHCIKCGECVKHCPQDIKIPNELGRIAHFVEKLKQNTL